MDHIVRRLAVLGGLLTAVLCLGGCFARITQKQTGDKTLETWDASGTKVLVRDIKLTKDGITFGPQVLFLKDSGKARVEIEGQQSLVEALRKGSAGGEMRISGSSSTLYDTDYLLIIRFYNYDLESITLESACEGIAGNGMVLKADAMKVRLSGASVLVADGIESKTLDVRVSGAGRLITEAIKTDTLTAVLSGASQLTTDRLEAGKTELTLSGASRAKLSDCRLSGSAEWKIEGASTLEAAGTGTDAVLRLSGASEGKLKDLVLREAKVTLSGASELSVTANEKLSGEASGSSDIRYSGSAVPDIKTSGNSSVEKE